MTRKKRSRQRSRQRQRKARASSRRSTLAGTIGSAVSDALSPLGWGRFAAGIAVGSALGIAAALIPDWPVFDRPGSADKVIAAATPESRDRSSGARVKIEMPQIVEAAAFEPAGAAPREGEASQPAPQYIEALQPVPPPQPVAAKVAPKPRQESGAAESAPGASAPEGSAPEGNVAGGSEVAAVGIVDVYPSGAPGDARWLRNSVAFSVPRGRPVIAVVLDDVGVNRIHAEEAIKLPPEITLSFMTYAGGVAEMATRARAKGHELMAHVPMEPLGGEIDPGPNALKVALSDSEILQRLRWGLDRFDGYVGINNHMGSRFTQDERGMRLVMQELQRRDLLFLDSRTIAASVGDRVAAEMRLAHLTRDVFLDDDMSARAVARQLAAAERIAQASGHAIAIGHPHPATIAAIKAWLPGAKARGFIIAPLSVVAKRRIGASG